MTKLVTKTSVALDPKSERIVKNLATSKGLNFSAALRMIVYEWDERLLQKNSLSMMAVQPEPAPEFPE